MEKRLIHINPQTFKVRPGGVSARLNVTPRVLSDLIVLTIGEASFQQADGRGTRRILSMKDACLVGLGKQLREHGFPPKRFRRCCDLVKDAWENLWPDGFTFTVKGPDSLQLPFLREKDFVYLVADSTLEQDFSASLVMRAELGKVLLRTSLSATTIVNLSGVIPGLGMTFYFAK